MARLRKRRGRSPRCGRSPSIQGNKPNPASASVRCCCGICTASYFVDNAQTEYLFVVEQEEGHWVTCSRYLTMTRWRLHLKGEEIYGVLGGDYTCFSAIDADSTAAITAFSRSKSPWFSRTSTGGIVGIIPSARVASISFGLMGSSSFPGPCRPSQLVGGDRRPRP